LWIGRQAALVLVVGGILYLTGCQKEEPVGRVVARVGKATLTLEQVEKEFPENLRGSSWEEEKRDYVRRWINEEILYQEALRRGLEKAPGFKSQLERVRRALLISYLLEKEMESSPLDVSDEEIQTYYAAHKGQFVWERDVVRLVHLIAQDKKVAREVKIALRRGENLEAVYQKFYPRVVSAQDQLRKFVDPNELPPRIAKIVRQMRVGQLYGPLKTELGYHILQLLEVQQKGTPKPLEECREDIKIQLYAIKQKEKYYQLLSSLKSKSSLWIDEAWMKAFVQTPSDTLKEGAKP